MVPLDKDEIQPGDSLPLTVLFSTRTYHGRIVKRPRIYHDGQEASSYVEIVTTVEADLSTASPLIANRMSAVFPYAAPPEALQTSIPFTNITMDTVWLSPVQLPDARVDVNLPVFIAPAATDSVSISVVNKPASEAFYQTLTIDAEGGATARYSIAIKRSGP